MMPPSGNVDEAEGIRRAQVLPGFSPSAWAYRVVISFVILCLTPSPAAPLVVPLHKPAPAAFDRFGFSVAFVGHDALVGAPFDDGGGENAGAAYVFDGTTGDLIRTLVNRDSGSQFGWSVAAAGGNIIGGAPVDGRVAPNAGAVFIYLPGQLTPRILQKSFPVAGDEFGFFVATVGSNVLVGAPSDDNGAEDAGAVYVFDGATAELQRTLQKPSPATGDSFGASIAALGTDVLVGAPFDSEQVPNGGAVFLFDGATGELKRTFRKPNPAAGDLFGAAVAAVGPDVLIGAPLDDGEAENAGAAYLFDGATGELKLTFQPPLVGAGDSFGASLAAVGTDVLVGAPLADIEAVDAGVAYLFRGSDGALLQMFEKPAPTTGARFGFSVAGVGNSVLIGAPRDGTAAQDAGSAYLFIACEPLCPTTTTSSTTTTTTTTTSTTTTIPVPCDQTTAPTCGGICPPADRCQPSGVGSGCECTPAPMCDQTAPACDGICPEAQTCMFNGVSCMCEAPCDLTAPACDGACAGGGSCMPSLSGCTCAAPCELTAPACNGTCPPGEFCFTSDLGCTCARPCEPTAGRCFGFCPGEIPCRFQDEACVCSPPPCDETAPACFGVCSGMGLCAPSAAGLDCVCMTPPACQVDADCDDMNPCNGDEKCRPCEGCFLYAWTCCGSPARCVRGKPPNCDDGDPCTTGGCDPHAGCQHVPVADGTPCAGNDACNRSKICIGGRCEEGTGPVCDDGNPCTADSCDSASGCRHVAVPNGTPCGDGSSCSGQRCQAGVCSVGAPPQCFEAVRCACAGGLQCADGPVPPAIGDLFARSCNLVAEAESIAGDTMRATGVRRRLVKSRVATALKTLPERHTLALFLRKQVQKGRISMACRATLEGRITGVRARARSLRAKLAGCVSAGG